MLQQGVLAYLDGLSVHPYRNAGPESVVADYDALRALMQKYLPANATAPVVISGEWGWSTCLNGSVPSACIGGAATGNSTYEDQAKVVYFTN